ncbi:hypothetical protein [Cylindrospermopsis raciborskii]|uniref:hypothetical protein n=1 Tax=Cylindrospermopsis raciborskii TaxID=77022 RepID=UPI001146178F|nr:hypothetical protein [Cylindrospermopsis raciborskii]
MWEYHISNFLNHISISEELDNLAPQLSRGNFLNVLKGDCAALPLGDRKALLTGERMSQEISGC